MTNVAKTIKYLAMALAIFLAISIISTLCYGVVLLGNVVSNDNSNINDKDNIRIENSVQLTSLEIMKEMDIDVKRVNIYIKYDDNFGVSTTNKYIKGRIQDNKLYIYEVDHSVIDKYEEDLYIFIPFGYIFDEVDIDNNAGRVEIDGLKTGELSLELGAGKVNMSNIEVYEKMDINGGAGSIKIDNANINNLDMDMGADKTQISGYLKGNNEIDAGVGALILELFDDDYKISVDKGIGKATYNGQDINSNEVYGNGYNNVIIDGGIGSIKISTKR